MKLLFITPQVPYPPQQGTTIRNYNLLRHLAKRHTIDLISFESQDDELTDENPLYQLCRRFEVVPQPLRTMGARLRDTIFSPLPDMGHRLESAEMHALIERWVANAEPGEWHIVQIEGIEVAQYGRQVLEGMKCRFGDQPGARPKLIFDNHNCEYLLQKRNALNDLRTPRRWVGGAYSVTQWFKLWRYERSVCHSTDATVAVSDADQSALQILAPQTRVATVPNGIDIDNLPVLSGSSTVLSSLDRELSILFIGKMDYRPNIDAMLWFGQEIFPLIKAEVADVRLNIVGLNPHTRLDPLRGDPAISITGKVEDVTPYLAAATAYVIPLRVGGGTRFKVLEAMAHSKAIVTTSLGIEGIPAIANEHLFIADTPEAFAKAVIRLLEEKARGEGKQGQTMGENSRNLVVEHFAWQHIVPRLEQLYQQIRMAQ
ncbi:MAG: glycosyltransferase [Chloroflexota bacterium]